MEQSKFIKTLNRLSKKQQEAYLSFLKSPYFNTNQSITKLVDLIMKPGTTLNPENLSLLVFPGKTYDPRRIPDLAYKALKQLEEFLSAEQYAMQSWEKKLNLLGYIRENDLGELQSVVDSEINELRNKKQHRDSQYFYEEFMYQSEADKIFRNQSHIRADQSLQQKVDQLDLFYLAAKLRDSCEMLNRANILSSGFEFRLVNKIIEEVQQDIEYYTRYPAIAIYFKIMQMLRDPEDLSHFHALQALIKDHIALFPRDEQRSIYGYLQNYSIRKVNRGRAEFYREILDTYQHMFEMNLMNADNKNLHWDLKNFVSIALRLGEYELTYKIINDVKPNLPADIRENAWTYNLANYHYETKDYRKATRLLQSVEFTDIYYNLDSKAMLLKIYFEQGEEETFYALVNAFKTFLSRNKLLSGDANLVYVNLVKLARKIFIFKMQLPYERKRNTKKINELMQKIINTKQVLNQTWLIKQVEEVLGKLE